MHAGILNPGFETGDLTNWTIAGTAPTPVVNSTDAHSGTYSAFLGDATPPESLGDSAFYQTTTVDPSSILSFWWKGTTTDSVTFDWQEATIRDTSGAILATIFHVAQNVPTWTQVNYDMSAFGGQTVRVEFLVHSDGFGDITNMRIDDVSLGSSVPEPASAALYGVGLAAIGLCRKIHSRRHR